MRRRTENDPRTEYEERVRAARDDNRLREAVTLYGLIRASVTITHDAHMRAMQNLADVQQEYQLEPHMVSELMYRHDPLLRPREPDRELSPKTLVW